MTDQDKRGSHERGWGHNDEALKESTPNPAKARNRRDFFSISLHGCLFLTHKSWLSEHNRERERKSRCNGKPHSRTHRKKGREIERGREEQMNLAKLASQIHSGSCCAKGKFLGYKVNESCRYTPKCRSSLRISSNEWGDETQGKLNSAPHAQTT